MEGRSGLGGLKFWQGMLQAIIAMGMLYCKRVQGALAGLKRKCLLDGVRFRQHVIQAGRSFGRVCSEKVGGHHLGLQRRYV